MKPLRIHYAIPVIIVIYFGIALIPIIRRSSSPEIFPFFTFKLFSRVPDTFERHDLLLDSGTHGERLLVWRSAEPNKVLRDYYPFAVERAGSDRAAGLKGWYGLDSLAPFAEMAILVKLRGEYTETILEGKMEVIHLDTLSR